MRGAPPAASRAKALRCCDGRSSRPPRPLVGPVPPDHQYYVETAARRLAVAHKLLKRSYHTLRELGEEALQPA